MFCVFLLTLFILISFQATEEDPTQPAAQVWARTQLFITIADVDDNPPVFDPSSTTATIAENAAVNSALNLDIEVEDKDSVNTYATEEWMN